MAQARGARWIEQGPYGVIVRRQFRNDLFKPLQGVEMPLAQVQTAAFLA
ncbi:hypothetical protein OVY01_22425 [Robbsia sp. Bb-Pol-6]|uniref:Uncharacterized protein n=1 Tax=Robbsia betulipollinis TaxID=2981849 RepID=A0ABT3ZVM9_9BURK|nr:hypothetical protein [Robbsia betulipollinis]MCY0389898.1 hypothetical protein [Robbsia betulipollinis]